jgi:hypothetical protein
VGAFISKEAAEKYAAALQAPVACACRVVSSVLLEGLKRNYVEGPQPETLEQVTNEDGSGNFLVANTSITPTVESPFALSSMRARLSRPTG